MENSPENPLEVMGNAFLARDTLNFSASQLHDAVEACKLISKKKRKADNVATIGILATLAAIAITRDPIVLVIGGAVNAYLISRFLKFRREFNQAMSVADLKYDAAMGTQETLGGRLKALSPDLPRL